MHIEKIQAFQCYFEIVYNPSQLSQTIYDANLTLKYKVSNKIPKLKFPPYVKDKYDFTLKFYFSNFHHCQPVNLPWLFVHHFQTGLPMGLCQF